MSVINTIRPVNIESVDLGAFKAHLADCVVITHDGKILMQQRPLSWSRFGGNLNLFDGHIESGESVSQKFVSGSVNILRLLRIPAVR